MPVSPSRQRCTDPYEPLPSSQMMRYLLMITVPLFSLRFTTLAVSRKLDRRRECEDELPGRGYGEEEEDGGGETLLPSCLELELG